MKMWKLLFLEKVSINMRKSKSMDITVTKKEKRMKKNHVFGITSVVGLLLFSALSASAAETYYKRADKQAVQQFTQETSGLTSALKAKEIELRQENTYTMSDSHLSSGPDFQKINALELEIKELKDKINSAAQKYDIVAQP